MSCTVKSRILIPVVCDYFSSLTVFMNSTLYWAGFSLLLIYIIVFKHTTRDMHYIEVLSINCQMLHGSLGPLDQTFTSLNPLPPLSEASRFSAFST